MTRRNRRKTALVVATCVAVLVAGAIRASAYVDGAHCKIWDVNGFQANLEICVDFEYAYQSDGDGRIWQVAQVAVLKGCDWLKHDGNGIITGIKAYAGDDTFPHLPTGSKSLVPQQRCWADRAIWLRGPDRGKMYVQLNMHVRVGGPATDKDPVFATVTDV